MRWGPAALAVSALLAAPACSSRFADAKVYNPCRHPIEVRLWTGSVPPFGRDHKPIVRVEPASTSVA